MASRSILTNSMNARRLNTKTEVDEDVRVRVARRKRERMRERLLSATRSIYLSGQNSGPAIAEDVIKAAGVSRGTFYKYFNSVDEVVGAVGQRLADEAVRELIMALLDNKPPPILGAAMGAQVLMSRAVLQPAWGDFVGRSGHLSQDSQYAAAVRRTTLAGRANGDFNFKSTKAAVDFQIGAVIEGIRRLVAGQINPRRYICEVTAMTLKGLGADHDRSDAASTQASRELSVIGPRHLPWWRDFN
jgi:AcrR family transcriptional regulator